VYTRSAWPRLPLLRSPPPLPPLPPLPLSSHSGGPVGMKCAVPRELINVSGKCVLHWLLQSLKTEPEDHVYIVHHAEIGRYEAFNTAVEACRPRADVRLVPLFVDTRGAVETLLSLLQRMEGAVSAPVHPNPLHQPATHACSCSQPPARSVRLPAGSRAPDSHGGRQHVLRGGYRLAVQRLQLQLRVLRGSAGGRQGPCFLVRDCPSPRPCRMSYVVRRMVRPVGLR